MSLKIKVLLVDDSKTIRMQVGRFFAELPDIMLVGEAEDGVKGLKQIHALKPDLVILDIEMPHMDGLETLKRIRAQDPKLPVLMFSTLTQKAATTTLDALSLGASDYVSKPSSTGAEAVSIDEVRDQLLSKIRALGGKQKIDSVKPAPWTAKASSVKGPSLPSNMRPPEIIVVGASTGGPNVLAAILERLPPNFKLPIVIVQHMPPLFTKLLADRLTAVTKLKVKEAQDGDLIEAPGAWLAPGGYHLALSLKAGRLSAVVHSDPPENSCRPAVDVLFRSAAQLFPGRVLGIVLTGMGRDGAEGARIIAQNGGSVIVQDQESSVVWSMPSQVLKAGVTAKVLPIAQLAEEMVLASQGARAAS